MSLDGLVERLNVLRGWAGVSYRELHRRLVRRRREAGIAEQPAYATVYRCLQPGRTRLDIDLVADIVTVLTDDEAKATHWRQAYAQLRGEATATAYASVFDTLPDDVDDFIGRDAELAAILSLGADANGAPAVLAIEGMAGVGKTTLAVRAAHRLREARRPELVLAVNLRGHDADRAPAEPMAVLDGFLRVLGEPGPRIQALDLAERSERYGELLADRSALVLLDNAASDDQIEPLLPRQPSALALVTSRRRVVRTSIARHVTLEVFTLDQAMGLLRRRAGEAVDGDPDSAARIVKQVGQLPLGVALVASRIEASAGWTLADHVEHLEERRSALRLDAGVELAFTTSYEALPPSLKWMLRLLALHPGRDCDAYAAAALAGIDLDTASRQLADLVDGSLLSSRVADRYELHDLVRIFALSRAREEDPPSARRAALTQVFDHYRWATAIAMDAYAPEEQSRRPQVPESGTEMPGIDDRATALAWLDAERANLIAIGTYTADHGWPEHVGHLSALLAPYLLIVAHFDDAYRLHDRASIAATGGACAAALKNLAVIRWHRGEPTEARELLVRALDAARVAGDRGTEARALTNLGNMHHYLGQYRQARDLFHRSLALGQELGDDTSTSRILMNLGITDKRVGDYDSALNHQMRALRSARSRQDRSTEMHVLENLSQLYNVLDDRRGAVQCAKASAAIADELGDPVGLAEALASLGCSYARIGRLDDAVDHQRRALTLAQSIASTNIELETRLELGLTLRDLGKLDAALEHHQRALEMAGNIERAHSQARAFDCLGADYVALGDTDAARTHWQHALDLYSKLQLPDVDRLRAQLKRLEPSHQAGSG